AFHRICSDPDAIRYHWDQIQSCDLPDRRSPRRTCFHMTLNARRLKSVPRGRAFSTKASQLEEDPHLSSSAYAQNSRLSPLKYLLERGAFHKPTPQDRLQ